MNNPNQQSSNFPFGYDPSAYDNPILNGLNNGSNGMAVDATPHQNSTAANFAAACYGFQTFNDPLHLSNFPYFSNQNSYFPIPTTTFPSTSLSIPAPIQSTALYPQHSSNLVKQPTSTTNNGSINSTSNRSTRTGVDKLLSRREKPKRKRVLFTAEQIRIMEEHFKQTQFTQHTERIKLSHVIGLSPQQIKIWYQNRRYKEKLTVRRPGNSEDSTPVRSFNKASPYSMTTNLTQNVKMEDEVKLECKTVVDNQIMAMQSTGPTTADYFPSIYSNWPQPNQQPSPFFPFNADMYANGFPGQQLNTQVNYPQMLHNFNTQTGFNPLSYYNPSNSSINPSNSSINPSNLSIDPSNPN